MVRFVFSVKSIREVSTHLTEEPKNEPVINCDENGNIVSIPAKDIIARHRQYQ